MEPDDLLCLYNVRSRTSLICPVSLVCFVYLVWRQTDQRDGAPTRQPKKIRFTDVERPLQLFMMKEAEGYLGGKTAEPFIFSSLRPAPVTH